MVLNPQKCCGWLSTSLRLSNVEGSVGLLANSPIPRDFSWTLTTCANTLELSHTSPFATYSLLNHVTEFIIFTSSSLHIQQLSMTLSGTFPTSRTKNPVQWRKGKWCLHFIFIIFNFYFYFILFHLTSASHLGLDKPIYWTVEKWGIVHECSTPVRAPGHIMQIEHHDYVSFLSHSHLIRFWEANLANPV